MTITQTPRDVIKILRFDKVQRAAHWANAGLFGILMFTAIPLYFGSFFGIVFPVTSSNRFTSGADWHCLYPSSSR